MKNFAFKALLCSMIVLIFGCSGEDKKKEAELQAKVEKTRTVLANHCSNDADCIVTGCRHTMCRAMPEPDYCDHRIVLAMDDAEDVHAVQILVSEMLTVREAESVRIGGYGAGKWTLSFHASPIQRKRVEEALNNLSMSGFARLHPQAGAHTKALYETLSKTESRSDLALREMRGAGMLVEKQIRSGDILSKDDIRAAWEQIAPAIESVHLNDDDEIERFWAYDVIFDKISQLRLWPIDKRQRITAKLWNDLESRVDNGDIILTASLAPSVVDTFKNWTSTGELIAILVGNEVVATAIPQKNITDGRFELVIENGASQETIVSNVETLKSVAHMKGGVHIDKKATENVERDISCHHQFPRECACIEGSCGWKMNADYNKCLYE